MHDMMHLMLEFAASETACKFPNCAADCPDGTFKSTSGNTACVEYPANCTSYDPIYGCQQCAGGYAPSDDKTECLGAYLVVLDSLHDAILEP